MTDQCNCRAIYDKTCHRFVDGRMGWTYRTICVVNPDSWLSIEDENLDIEHCAAADDDNADDDCDTLDPPSMKICSTRLVFADPFCSQNDVKPDNAFMGLDPAAD